MIVWSRWATVNIVTSVPSSFLSVDWITASVLWSRDHNEFLHFCFLPENTDVPMADVAMTNEKKVLNYLTDLDRTNRSPSSKMRSLLLRTIALAKAIIWRWPTERLFPPLAISLSRVRRASSPSAWREKSPDARNASLSVASSCCEKGSKFRRRVPANRDHSNCSTLRRFSWRLTTQKLGLNLGKLQIWLDFKWTEASAYHLWNDGDTWP